MRPGLVLRHTHGPYPQEVKYNLLPKVQVASGHLSNLKQGATDPDLTPEPLKRTITPIPAHFRPEAHKPGIFGFMEARI